MSLIQLIGIRGYALARTGFGKMYTRLETRVLYAILPIELLSRASKMMI